MTISTSPTASAPRRLRAKATTGAGRCAAGGAETVRHMIEGAFASASSHAPNHCFVIVKADNLEFRRDASAPSVTARVIFAGRSTLTVVVELADNRAQPAASGRFMMMAVDNDGSPIPLSQNQRPKEILP